MTSKKIAQEIQTTVAEVGHADGAKAVDRQIGTQIRVQRQQANMSQLMLGERIGVTFQQVQKYERGSNRVSSSTLYEIACALGKPIDCFFEGLPRPRYVDAIRRASSHQIADSDVTMLSGYLGRINQDVRDSIIDLIEAITDRYR